MQHVVTTASDFSGVEALMQAGVWETIDLHYYLHVINGGVGGSLESVHSSGRGKQGVL